MLTKIEMMEIAKRFQAGFDSAKMRDGVLRESFTGSFISSTYQMYEIETGQTDDRFSPEDVRRKVKTYFTVSRKNGAVTCKSWDVFDAMV